MTTRLRKATMDDMLLVYHWINEVEVRKQSYRQKSITPEEHSEWFNYMVNNPDEYYYIFEVSGKPAGQIRFDLHDKGLVMHNLLSPEVRGRGLNMVLMRTAIERVLKDAPVQITNLQGYIKKANAVSWEVFRNLPFRRELSTEYTDSYKVVYSYCEQKYFEKSLRSANSHDLSFTT